MTEQWLFYLMSFLFIFFLQTISCFPVSQVRLPKNEVQYSNGTIVGSFSYKDGGGNPIDVKYYANDNGYGVEYNSFKAIKIVDTTPEKEPLQGPKLVKKVMVTSNPLLDLASEILHFDNKINKANDGEGAKNPQPIISHFRHLDHVEHTSKITRTSVPDYETYYQNEVKAPKQCEKDKVRIYLAKETRKKKNAIDNLPRNATTYCG